MCSINTLLKYVNLSKNEKFYLQIIIIMAFTLALFKKLLRKYPIYFLKFFPSNIRILHFILRTLIHFKVAL